jgi:hypothetical protein
MDLTKLGRTERVLAVAGLLVFIDSFLPWYSVSAGAYSASANGWGVGFGGWFPVLLILAVGVVAALPAFGQSFSVRGGYAAYGVVTLVATLIILIRWLTYPSDNGLASAGVSAGASFGTYIAVIVGIVAVVFSYLGFTAGGGSLNNLGAAFSAPAQQFQPGAQPYPPSPPQYQAGPPPQYQQAPPYQPEPPTQAPPYEGWQQPPQ